MTQNISQEISPAPGIAITPAGEQDKCFIACPIFEKELRAVLGLLAETPAIRYMHYSIHNNPSVMENELSTHVEQARAAGEEVRFLVGKNCKGKRDIMEIAEGCSGKVPRARNCIEMLVGREKTRELQQNRTSVMTPAWISMINQSIRDDQWTVEDARINLGWYNQVLILDTGVEPLDDEMIMEFFDLIQVPIDILPVELDHFCGVVSDLLQ
ncbi:MAG: DUF1638 domain-containing protein [Thermodesulfobacteriota bacterium]